MSVKSKVLSAGVLFFLGGQMMLAQKAKNDTVQKEKEIQEVKIVVAYGRQTKESITGSVAEVKSETLKQITAGNVVQGMTGKVAGVQISSNNGLPGEAPTVRFRGVGSINGSSAPLYVVDGVPFNGDIAAINNADIESTSFLKDASAAALYGSRGANGVIIITTKKGRRGATRFSLDMKAGVAMRGVQEYDILTDPRQYYEVYHRMLKNGFINGGSTSSVAHQEASNELVSVSSSGLGYNITNVSGNQIIGLDGKFNPNATILYKEDWAKELFKRGFYTNTHFSASGGSDNTTFFYSLGYESNDTYMVNAKFEKITGRLKIDSKLGDKIKIGGNMAYTNMIQNAPDGFSGGSSYSSPFNWTRNIAPIYPVYAYNADGTPVYINGVRVYDDGTGTLNGGIVRPYGELQNPLATALLDKKRNVTNQIFASAYATYSILKGLDFTYNISGEFYNYRKHSYDTDLYGDAKDFGGRLSNTNYNTVAITNQQLLTYDRKIGGVGMQVLLGHETLNRSTDMMYYNVQRGILSSTLSSNHFLTLNSADGRITPYATEGYFGRLNLDYAGKYFLNGNIRRDGSSRFHKDNRWGTFFGIGGAWVVSRENFLKNASWINTLRLKASYGEQGNDNLGTNSGQADAYFYNFPYANQYEITQTTNAEEIIISLSQVFKGNKNITWEKNANMNAGLDLSLFNNRVNIDAEYFVRKSYDMLYRRPLKLSDGFASMPENIGDMENRGVEVTADFGLIRNDNFSLSLNGNVTFLKNKILKLAKDDIVSGSYILKEGNSMYTWRLREFVGVNQTNGAAQFTVIDPITKKRTITEVYTDATLVDTGKTSIPKFYGGFGLDMKVKNIDFAVSFAYQFGGWGYDGQWMSTFAGDVGENFHQDFANTWTNDNPKGYLPVVLPQDSKQYYNMSTLGLIKSDYVSLQNVSLGYTFDKGIMEMAGVKSLRVFAAADNVFVWSKRKGYDPRMSFTGISSSAFSPIRTISVGLNASF